MLFRAFYALPDKIVGPDGRPVNALLGTANLILREVEVHQPRAVVLCFGPDAAAYRTELYPAYHAEREEAMPDELPHQFADSRAFFEAFGWTVTVADDLEADDLLGTYATLEAATGGHALLLTGDRDMYQCAGEDVTVLYVRTGGGKGAEEVGPAEVRERYGIDPGLVPDFIALRGDPSDGLPGREGCRSQDRGGTASRAWLAGGDPRWRDSRAAAGAAGGVDRGARGPAQVQGHCDASRRQGQTAQRPLYRLGGRG